MQERVLADFIEFDPDEYAVMSRGRMPDGTAQFSVPVGHGHRGCQRDVSSAVLLVLDSERIPAQPH
jgi:hypothetical protein